MSRAVAPMPPALTNATANAAPATSGSFASSLALTFVASPSSSLRSSTAAASLSRSSPSSRRISCSSAVAILQRLRRQLRFDDCLLRNGRRPLLHLRAADKGEDRHQHDEPTRDDQERCPHWKRRGEPGRDRREPEPDGEKGEDGRADEQPDADAELGDLLLELGSSELQLEPDERARAFADELRSGTEPTPFLTAGGHDPSSQSALPWPLPGGGRRPRRRTDSGRRRAASASGSRARAAAWADP